MAETIASIFDTDEVWSYIHANKDVFEWFETDEDEEDIPEDVQDAIIDKVVASSTDGRLRNALYDHLDTWIGEQFMDMMYEVLDDYIGEEIRYLMSKKD